MPAGAEVELVSDSQYVLKGLTEWRAGWERKGFRNSKGEPVANLALWKRLFAAADARRVTRALGRAATTATAATRRPTRSPTRRWR